VKIRKICFGFSIAIATLSTLFGYSLSLEASRGSGLVASAYPRQMELQIFPAPNRKATNPNPICPEKVTITETSRPYIEAAYVIDGIAKLDAIAEKFSVFVVDDFSVTWAAKLKPKYLDCHATGRVLRVDGEKSDYHSYLRLRFVQGKVFLILDMTGMFDPNEQTTSILDHGVKNGNPTWTWGGTD
jgi:hypothetical protein